MSVILTSHIAQLLYPEAPNLNLAQVVGDIRNAFTPANMPAAVLTWDCDDIALLDFGTSRVMIGFSENLPGPHAACLTVATDQKQMCRAVRKRLNRRFPGADNQGQILEQSLTPDLIDRVVDALFDQAEEAAPSPDVTATVEAFPEVAAPVVALAPTDTDHLINRLSSELTNRPANVIARAIASVATNGSGEKQASAGTAPTFAKATKLSTGVFWRKPNCKLAEPHRTSSNASSSELTAVRQALCASDRDDRKNRFTTQTKHALLSFVSSIADIRRANSPMTSVRSKH